MQSGANRSTGPSGHEEHNQQGYYSQPSYQDYPDASSAQVAPYAAATPPLHREPRPSLAELQQLRTSRARMAQLRFEARSLFDIHTEVSLQMQAEPLADDIDGQIQQGEMRAALARGMGRYLEGLGEGRGHVGYSEEWTINHTYQPGYGG